MGALQRRVATVMVAAMIRVCPLVLVLWVAWFTRVAAADPPYQRALEQLGVPLAEVKVAMESENGRVVFLRTQAGRFFVFHHHTKWAIEIPGAPGSHQLSRDQKWIASGLFQAAGPDSVEAMRSKADRINRVAVYDLDAGRKATIDYRWVNRMVSLHTGEETSRSYQATSVDSVLFFPGNKILGVGFENGGYKIVDLKNPLDVRLLSKGVTWEKDARGVKPARIVGAWVLIYGRNTIGQPTVRAYDTRNDNLKYLAGFSSRAEPEKVELSPEGVVFSIASDKEGVVYQDLRVKRYSPHHQRHLFGTTRSSHSWLDPEGKEQTAEFKNDYAESVEDIKFLDEKHILVLTQATFQRRPWYASTDDADLPRFWMQRTRILHIDDVSRPILGPTQTQRTKKGALPFRAKREIIRVTDSVFHIFFVQGMQKKRKLVEQIEIHGEKINWFLADEEGGLELRETVQKR